MKRLNFKVADFFEDPYYGSYMVGTKRIYLNKDDFDILRNTKVKEFNYCCHNASCILYDIYKFTKKCF